MSLSPQRIRDTNFKSARKGYDPGEVDAFVEDVAAALETAQNEATAMEARARAAVARLQELAQPSGEAAADGEVEVHARVDESETISRTLLLAQRTADTTVAEAQVEADRVLAAARDEAATGLDGARQEAARLIDEARTDARRAGESERVQVEGEVQALLARRDFLESDVDHLEQHLVAQRERITEAAAELTNLAQRVPGGLGDMRRPLLSAAADEPQDEDTGDADSEIAEITKVAEGTVEPDAIDAEAGGDTADETAAIGVDSTPSNHPLFDDDGEPTAPVGKRQGTEPR